MKESSVVEVLLLLLTGIFIFISNKLSSDNALLRSLLSLFGITLGVDLHTGHRISRPISACLLTYNTMQL